MTTATRHMLRYDEVGTLDAMRLASPWKKSKRG